MQVGPICKLVICRLVAVSPRLVGTNYASRVFIFLFAPEYNT